MNRRFSIGKAVATPGAMEALSSSRQLPEEFLLRHVAGDWGDLDVEDKVSNEEAIANGDRLLSAYITKKGVKLWVITEADRSSTCILLPEEY